MWRLLEIGEVRKEGDKFLPTSRPWELITTIVGLTVRKGDNPVIRKISGQGEAEKPADNNRYMVALEAYNEYTKLKGDGMGLKLNFREWLHVRLNPPNTEEADCT